MIWKGAAVGNDQMKGMQVDVGGKQRLPRDVFHYFVVTSCLYVPPRVFSEAAITEGLRSGPRLFLRNLSVYVAHVRAVRGTARIEAPLLQHTGVLLWSRTAYRQTLYVYIVTT